MRKPRYTIGRLMILIAAFAFACWLSWWFLFALAVVPVFIGPTLGAWRFGWRLQGPYPNAIDGAMTGVLIQSLLAGAAAFLVATPIATDESQ
ncbi:hypothetical protein [Singulisphaera sp. PoT]|uniref:hypothetical protein n=1 Tax=Singulisphaera sp. PoT TaxID=3411797 RepID=UPI003BF5D016